MTDEQIKFYVKQLTSKGASVEDIDKFVESAIKEREPEKSDSFLTRLKTSFGSKEERAKIKEPKGFLKGGVGEAIKDVADVAGKALPIAGMIGGGIIGGGAGLFGGGPVGVLAGGALGAGTGAGIGEKARQDIGTGLGLQKSTVGEKVKEASEEFVLGAAGEVGGRVLGTVVKPVISKFITPLYKNAKNMFKDMISVMTSVPEKAIERAATESSTKAEFSEVVNATTIREEAVKAYNSVRNRMGQEFSDGLEALKNKFKTGIKGWPDIRLNKIVNDTTSGIPSIFRKFKVSVLENGKILDFDKMSSPIVKAGEQNNLKAVWDTIRNQTDFSVNGVEAVAARINALSKFTDGTKTETSAIISKIHNIYDKAIQKSFPELGALRKTYAVTSNMLKNANDVINATGERNTKAVRAAVAKLTNLFREDNDIYINSLIALEESSGTKFLSKLAGTEFQKITPGILRTSVAVGGLATMMQSPSAILIVPLFSPRFWGGVLVKSAQARSILNGIFKNFMGVKVLDSATKILINDIIRGKLE